MLSSKELVSQDGRFTWMARWFGLQFALVVPFIHVLLKILGYSRTLMLLKRSVANNSRSSAPYNGAETFSSNMFRLIRHVRKRSPLSGSCLSRSLALWWLLQHKGIDTALRIGTKNNSDSFLAHAWIEYLGYPLNAGQKVRQRYATFDTVFTF